MMVSLDCAHFARLVCAFRLLSPRVDYSPHLDVVGIWSGVSTSLFRAVFGFGAIQLRAYFPRWVFRCALVYLSSTVVIVCSCASFKQCAVSRASTLGIAENVF